MKEGNIIVFLSFPYNTIDELALACVIVYAFVHFYFTFLNAQNLEKRLMTKKFFYNNVYIISVLMK